MSARKSNKKGFTLIELLVVVLIIGILAAIALPQYFRAVEKSRASEALTVLASLGSAMERVRLAKGIYPQDKECAGLDIDYAWDKIHDYCVGQTNNFVFYNKLGNNSGELYAYRLNASGDGTNYGLVKQLPSGKVFCINGSKVNTDICSALNIDEYK